jgi:hypothetical protein
MRPFEGVIVVQGHVVMEWQRRELKKHMSQSRTAPHAELGTQKAKKVVPEFPAQSAGKLEWRLPPSPPDQPNVDFAVPHLLDPLLQPMQQYRPNRISSPRG